jgi:4'-phosphopantetheinyl transferase
MLVFPMKIFITDLSTMSDASILEKYPSLLQIDELERLEKITHPHRKLQFLAGRVVLKTCLSQALNKPANAINLSKNAEGKLYLPDASMHFNISHSKNKVVVGISDYEVGVDIEFMCERDFAALADMVFLSEEAGQIWALKDNQQMELFYKFWTLQEAYVKCFGGNILAQVERLKGESHSFKFEEEYMVSVCGEELGEVELGTLELGI